MSAAVSSPHPLSVSAPASTTEYNNLRASNGAKLSYSKEFLLQYSHIQKKDLTIVEKATPFTVDRTPKSLRRIATKNTPTESPYHYHYQPSHLHLSSPSIHHSAPLLNQSYPVPYPLYSYPKSPNHTSPRGRTLNQSGPVEVYVPKSEAKSPTRHPLTAISGGGLTSSTKSIIPIPYPNTPTHQKENIANPLSVSSPKSPRPAKLPFPATPSSPQTYRLSSKSSPPLTVYTPVTPVASAPPVVPVAPVGPVASEPPVSPAGPVALVTPIAPVLPYSPELIERLIQQTPQKPIPIPRSPPVPQSPPPSHHMSTVTPVSSPSRKPLSATTSPSGKSPFRSSPRPISPLDEQRLLQRQKQIDYGYRTVGYLRYRLLVAKDQRRPEHPRTPKKNQGCSKRSWDGQLKKWRRDLHLWDPDSIEAFRAVLDSDLVVNISKINPELEEIIKIVKDKLDNPSATKDDENDITPEKDSPVGEKNQQGQEDDEEDEEEDSLRLPGDSKFHKVARTLVF